MAYFWHSFAGWCYVLLAFVSYFLNLTAFRPMFKFVSELLKIVKLFKSSQKNKTKTSIEIEFPEFAYTLDSYQLQQFCSTFEYVNVGFGVVVLYKKSTGTY